MHTVVNGNLAYSDGEFFDVPKGMALEFDR